MEKCSKISLENKTRIIIKSQPILLFSFSMLRHQSKLFGSQKPTSRKNSKYQNWRNSWEILTSMLQYVKVFWQISELAKRKLFFFVNSIIYIMWSLEGCMIINRSMTHWTKREFKYIKKIGAKSTLKKLLNKNHDELLTSLKTNYYI